MCIKITKYNKLNIIFQTFTSFLNKGIILIYRKHTMFILYFVNLYFTHLFHIKNIYKKINNIKTISFYNINEILKTMFIKMVGYKMVCKNKDVVHLRKIYYIYNV